MPSPPLVPRGSLDALEVDGAIVVEPELNDQVVEFFFDRGVDVVSVGRAPDQDHLLFVDLQSGARPGCCSIICSKVVVQSA